VVVVSNSAETSTGGSAISLPGERRAKSKQKRTKSETIVR